MADDEEVFQPRVEPWTVGQLRAAIDGVPDDLRVSVLVPPGPGGDRAENRWVIHADLNVATYVEAAPESGHLDDVRKVLLIQCDLPPGS